MSDPNSRDKNKKFQYGNYNRYYGYRKQDASEEDLRLRFLKPEWFTGKKVLDIGCNVGKLTDAIARTFFPKSLTGMDIDKDLINVARKNLRKCRDAKESGAFPKSMSILYGSISAGPNGSGEYPSNLGFICGITFWIQMLSWIRWCLSFTQLFVSPRPSGSI
ncbi:Putative methyltransferase bin3like [Caligus rogercresseyi]|uniref:RNA methyltransferase n=1 Tax=Caligus rogercresseyi TaxID=217165 RepID=A0A7T8KGT5_CALRO|nr:Putative methyltransferase bin3like [Caligus rogercresseyi]